MIINDWKMDFDGHVGLSCSVPCDMYSVLYSHGIIEDPYYGTNEEHLYDLSRKNCTFYTSLSLGKGELEKEKIELNFYGIDTICDVYFNGTHLGKTMNMHRLHSFDIKALAKEENEIRLEISAPLEYFDKMDALHHLYTDGASAQGASHLRKAYYMSGWDWAPRLPNMGIFRSVELCAYDVDKIEDIYVVQHHEDGKVRLEISVSTRHGAQNLTASCEFDGKAIPLNNGKCEITVESPRLWWPNGYGEQFLYDVEISLYSGSRLIDKATKQIGLRTLVLCRENDEYGQEFCFKVNGVKIFAMGANHVPVDSLPSRITKQRLERLIQDCVFANFNCVRVWGGAFYPDDYFYELCDKYGLIVWQDFMVACANVWLRPEFENEFVAEAIYNVKRIRHHACLGLLCGNNEMEEALCNWPCADGGNEEIRRDYLRLYEEILPRLCAEYAPYISYTSSSPTSYGGLDDPNNHTVGDVHFWDVWNGGCQFDEYRKHKFRFCSEYGFESLPCIKTIDAFCPPSERNLLSYTMESHQKHWHGNVKLLNYLAEMYQAPKSLEATVYASQLNQASAIKYGVEHFRRCRGYTMGSIYWQLNDSWPVASWSSIDYYGRYKALHYFAKRFYKSVSLGLFNEQNEIAINVSNETMSDFNGYVKFGVMKSDFSTVYEAKHGVCIKALSSADVEIASNSEFNGHRDAYFFAELYSEDGTLIAREVELGSKPKHFKLLDPKIKIEARDSDGGVIISLRAEALAKNVEISFKNHDIVLDDNYFDLPNAEPYPVFAETELSASEILNEISIMSVYDIKY